MNVAQSRRLPVSVITVNYNAGALLEACVSLALAQAKEVIVVDNASSDDSLARLEGLSSGDRGLRIIRNESNIGFAAGCNIGTAAATSNYLLFLNPDCLLTPGSVAKLVNTLDQSPHAGMAGALLTEADGTEQAGGRRAVPTPWRAFVRAFGLSRFADRYPRLFYDFHLHQESLPDHATEVEAISGACMLVRREAIDDVGLMDEDYFMHCEDLDWCMRFRQKSWAVLFVPHAKVVHHRGVCSRSRPIFVEWHKHKGMIRFYRKFFRHQYPGLLMWLVSVGVWVHFTGMAGYHSLKKAGRFLGVARG